MKKKLLALMMSMTLCLGSTMTVNAAMPMLPGSGSGSGALSGLNNDKLTIKDLGQTNTNDSKSYKSNYTKLEINVIKSLFDPEYYAKQYPDVVLALGNNKEALWNHYVSHGFAEGRQINKNFNVLAYSAAYPDLQKAFGDDILAYYVHYMNYGKNENRQLTTLEKAASAGITVKGMNGQVIANPALVVPKVNLVNNSNSNNNESLASAVQGTMNINNGSGSGSSDSGDKKPEETVCQHEYEVTKIAIEAGYHIINKKCAKCGDVVEGTPEDHNYSTVKDFGNGQHGGVCVCEAWVEGTLQNHEIQYTYQDEAYHKSYCTKCDYSTEELHTYQDGKCSVCNYEHKEHSWNSETGECSICEKICEHSHYFSNSKTAINTDTTHRIDKVCSHCGYVTIGEEEEHTFGSPNHIEGTLTHKRTCACGAEKIESCRSMQGWNPTETYHYHVCEECYGETSRQEHNFSNGICVECGYSCREHQWSDGKCTVCGYECDHHGKRLISAEPVNPSEHKATYICDICSKECIEVENCDLGGFESIDGTYHGQKCIACGNVANKQAHNFCNSGKKDDNNHTKSCSMCGYSVDEAHYDDEGVRSLDSTQHGKVCDVCGSYFENAKHTFGEDGKCTVCGEDCTHSNTENTIETIDGNAESHKVVTKCKDCGQLINEATVDHNFGDWQYEAWYQHKKVCSDCGWAIIENCEDYQEYFRYTPNLPNSRMHTVTCGICNGEWSEYHDYSEDTICRCGQPQNNNSGDDDDVDPGILDDDDYGQEE